MKTLAAALLFGLLGVATADDQPPAAPKCRALDADNKTLAEASDASSVKCGTLLMEAVRKVACTAAMKGKKVDYTVSSDHVIGKAKVKDRKTSLTCTAVKAK